MEMNASATVRGSVQQELVVGKDLSVNVSYQTPE